MHTGLVRGSLAAAMIRSDKGDFEQSRNNYEETGKRLDKNARSHEARLKQKHVEKSRTSKTGWRRAYARVPFGRTQAGRPVLGPSSCILRWNILSLWWHFVSKPLTKFSKAAYTAQTSISF